MRQYQFGFGPFAASGRSSIASIVAVLAAAACSAGAPSGPSQGDGIGGQAPNNTVPGDQSSAGQDQTGEVPGAVAPGQVPGAVAPGSSRETPGTAVTPNASGSVTPPTGLEPGDQPLIEETPGGIIGEPPPETPPEGQLVDGEVCNAKGIEFEKLVPVVMILVDRSTSMFASNLPNGASPAFGEHPDRWEALRVAVAGLEPLAADVAFGLSTYTGYNAGMCPEMPQIDSIVPGQAEFAQIMAELPSSAEALPPQKSETPTYEAITAGIEALKAVEIVGPKYLLVITDGEPDTCQLFDPQCGQDAAIGAAQAAFAEGISTYVVDAAPALIVLIAAHGAFGNRPELVLSGVNHGANLGQVILHSGTVGAALTAGVNDSRGLAVSLDVGGKVEWEVEEAAHEPHWNTAAGIACRLIPFLADQPTGTVLNLNVPDLDSGAVAGLRSAPLADFGIVQTTMTERFEGDLRLTVADTAARLTPDTDAAVLAEGYAAVTAIESVRAVDNRSLVDHLESIAADRSETPTT